MTDPWVDLDAHDRETLHAIIAFLNKRLGEQETIDWALKLEPRQRIERIAISYLLTGQGAGDLAKPWAEAWRLIEESWSSPRPEEPNGTAIYHIGKRLQAGDRSGAAVAAIVHLVAPRLEVESVDASRRGRIKKPRTPKSVAHILSARLASGRLIDLNVLKLAKLNDVAFLTSLATALEAVVNQGLDTARRLGWDEQSYFPVGFLNRVYYTQSTRGHRQVGDPDAGNQGIAPSVKLLHAVVARIAEIQPTAAQPFVRRWQVDESSIFTRLWSAMARNSELVEADVVSSFLKSLDNLRFWNLHMFPDIAEVRALRFGEFDLLSQRQIAARLQRGRPRNQWPRSADKAKVADASLYWAVRELRRIEAAGCELPANAETWMEARLSQFVDLARMTIDAGFLEGITVDYIAPDPDSRYDSLQGLSRLTALETALVTLRGGWDADPAGRAKDWIGQQGNADKLLADFESANNSGDDFPEVWNRFGWAHRPPREVGGVDIEADRVLNLLDHLSESTVSSSIDGICAWLDAWKDHVVRRPLALPIWLRLWPIAVEATNRRPVEGDDEDLNVTARIVNNDREPLDLDTLNTPAGKLIGVFLAACPDLPPGAKAFPPASMERQMRDLVVAAEGRSGLIAKHRMIECLPYFLHADAGWTGEHLIAPLNKDDTAALALWRAVARGKHGAKVLESIGSAMVERANDPRLGRETRERLVFSLVIESLHAFREARQSVVPNQRIQQLLRTLDDEVRASAANAVQQFVRELSASAASNAAENSEERKEPASAAVLFQTAAAPFLREVWPQERSLVTPGVSSALADLPATSGEAFAEAVDTISRFLVPFNCWSMVEYGLYGNEGGTKRLDIINNKVKAQALLVLFDLTIGKSEGAVVPHDITDALDQILTVDPSFRSDAVFRRLATAARR